MRTSELLILFDIGSNAVRCILAELTPGLGFELLRQERGQTRLGGGSAGVLPKSAIEDTVEIIQDFLQEVRAEVPGGQQTRVLAIATAAVRDAADRNDFLCRLHQETGITVRVLSGEEEARLGALAAIERLALRDGVVIDIGGGSLQTSLVRAGSIHRVSSVPLGAVRATKSFFKNDPPSQREIRSLREEVRQQVRAILPIARKRKTLIGLGGTVRTLASMQIATLNEPRPSRQGFRLLKADITKLREQLEASSARERRRIPGLKAERVDIILAGAVVVEEVMALGGYEVLTVCKEGVRHGLLLHEVHYRSAEYGGKSVP